MRIALISCTSRKKEFKCHASDLYSESPRFRLAYTYAKLVADKIFILSAKYGLVSEDMIIEPYNETLKDKKVQERRLWGDMVLAELRKVADLQNDEFIVLAGEVYRENLLPHLANFWIPLKGKSQGEWIPELKRLIKLESESDKAIVLHTLFNGLPRLDWTMINRIPYQNGIYIMFEKGESLVNEELETKLEEKISQYLRENITFVCIPVDDKNERLRLEEGMIASLNNNPSFGPSNNWLGLKSPLADIANSGLWNRQGLQGRPLTDEELERIKWLVSFGNDNYKNPGSTARSPRAQIRSVERTAEEKGSKRKIADDIRDYIEKLLQEAKPGRSYIDLVSGDIHKKMGMKNRMPEICRIMYEKMMPGDEILHTTPSGKSSTIKIRYYLNNR